MMNQDPKYMKKNLLFLKEQYHYDNLQLVELLGIPLAVLNRISDLEYAEIKGTKIKFFISICVFFEISLMDLCYTDLSKKKSFLIKQDLVNQPVKVYLRKNMRFLSAKKNLSIKDFASMTSKTDGHFYYYFSGRIPLCNLSIGEVLDICRQFSLTPDRILFHDLLEENKTQAKHHSKKRMIRRGEIYLADLGTGIGSEQNGIRPVVVLQNNTGNRFSPTTIVACVTSTKKKKLLPTHMQLNINSKVTSFVTMEQIRTISQERLIKYMGTIPEDSFSSLDSKLDISLGIKKG